MHIQVIIGSVRKGRICPAIAKWVADVVNTHDGFTAEIVDIADYQLPMDGEEKIPRFGHYDTKPIVSWSEKIQKANGYVFVFPQYNWGYPAAIKNAVDALYKEWNNKPGVIVSYGKHGGNKAGAQFREVLNGLDMKQPSENIQVVVKFQLDDFKVGAIAVEYEEYTPKLNKLLDEVQQMQ